MNIAAMHLITLLGVICLAFGAFCGLLMMFVAAIASQSNTRDRGDW